MATSPLTSNHAFSHASDILDIFNWPLDETNEAIRVAPDLETSRLFKSFKCGFLYLLCFLG